jgi:CheY-like chemotaxis protein
MNLVSNAIKFTERGGIRIEARRVRSTDAGSPDLIRFAVADSGIGMDTEAGRKLFQRFTQLESSTSRKFGGTGLGLAIAQGIVQMMGGRIEFESEQGKGSTFHFSIPFAEAESRAEGETGTMPVFRAGGMEVLVIDDNRVNRKVALSILEKLGCRVETAESGEEALSILESRSFDLVLMDCHMPGMDGFETARRIRSWAGDASDARARAAATPIVALTADVLPDIRERCLAARMDGVLAKPFSQEQLASEISRWGGARVGSAPGG